MILVFTNTARVRLHDRGFTSTEIEARPTPVYRGDADGAVRFLMDLGVGVSVEVRACDDAGKMRWLRSCLNKPALWDDIQRDAETQAYKMHLGRAVAMAEIREIVRGLV